MTPTSVEQVFLRPRSGSVEVLLVLEDEAGARVRETLPLATPDRQEAARQVALHLARRCIVPARKVRLRVERRGELSDDGELLRYFLAELERLVDEC